MRLSQNIITAETTAEPAAAAPQFEKLTHVQPTKEGAEILKQLAIKGKEIIQRNATPEEAPDIDVKWVAAAIKDMPGASLKPADKKGYRHALVIKKEDGKEEVWYLHMGGYGSSPWGLATRQFSLINKDDPQMIGFYHRYRIPDKEDIQNSLDEARRNASSQKNDPAQVKTFDLTRKKPIGYLCFNGFDDDDKPSRTQYFEYAKALPELLNRCGYDMVCLDNDKRIEDLKSLPTANGIAGLVANPGVSGMAGFAAGVESPAKLVERRIDALHRQGVRAFYLSFLTHGDRKKGMLGADGKWLSGDELKKIMLKYKDCTFTIDATGCEGGGLIGMMREFKDVPEAAEGRIGVFVHTKEELSILSHEYQCLMIKMLTDMAGGAPGAPKTYGEAHYRADEETKRATYGFYDPEFWKSAPGGSKRTAQKETPGSNPLEDAARQYFSGHVPAALFDDLQPRHELTEAVKLNAPGSRRLFPYI